jgi:peptidoglycan/LPS O-acetylase OafA/YrhL
MASTKPTYIHFPNLDGLRFVLALGIIILHVDGIMLSHNKTTVSIIKYFTPDGPHLVTFFYVLSGFLISYLLLKEQQDTGSISLKRYYIRRTLRIWPLYYFIGFFGIFIFPLLNHYLFNDYVGGFSSHLWLSAFLYMLFIYSAVPQQVIGATWSVRVEEAFYLLWPVLVKYFKNFMQLCLLVIVATIITRNLCVSASKHIGSHLLAILAQEAKNYRVSSMALGGIGAYLYLNKNNSVLSILYRRDVQYMLYGCTFLLLIFKPHFPVIYYEVYAFFFSIIVLNLATNPASILRLDYKWMNYLGKISYGLYMYNSIMRILCLEGIERVFGRDINGPSLALLLYPTTILSTIFISILSYEFFEKKFIRLKDKWN